MGRRGVDGSGRGRWVGYGWDQKLRGKSYDFFLALISEEQGMEQILPGGNRGVNVVFNYSTGK